MHKPETHTGLTVTWRSMIVWKHFEHSALSLFLRNSGRKIKWFDVFFYFCECGQVFFCKDKLYNNYSRNTSTVHGVQKRERSQTVNVHDWSRGARHHFPVRLIKTGLKSIPVIILVHKQRGDELYFIILVIFCLTSCFRWFRTHASLFKCAAGARTGTSTNLDNSELK